MIKVLILTFFSFLCLNVNAVEISSNWNDEYKKGVKFSCVQESEEHLCLDLCEEPKSCVISERVCRSCVANSIYLTKIFTEMGQSFRNTGVKVYYRDLINLLLSGNFVSMTSKSIYNIIESFNSLTMRERFQSLCSDGTKYPVVFFGMDNLSDDLEDVIYVACNDGVYEMTDMPEVVLNDGITE